MTFFPRFSPVDRLCLINNPIWFEFVAPTCKQFSFVVIDDVTTRSVFVSLGTWKNSIFVKLTSFFKDGQRLLLSSLRNLMENCEINTII